VSFGVAEDNKENMKKTLAIVAIFCVGVVIGIILMGYLSMGASRTYLEIYRANYHADQLWLASEAHREGNKYAEFVYRTNVADMSNLGKIKTIENMKNTWSFGFPFAAIILDRIASGPNMEIGRQRGYAVELARLAEATENIGLITEADRLWAESAQLMGHGDINKMRALVTDLHKIDDNANTSISK